MFVSALAVLLVIPAADAAGQRVEQAPRYRAPISPVEAAAWTTEERLRERGKLAERPYTAAILTEATSTDLSTIPTGQVVLSGASAHLMMPLELFSILVTPGFSLEATAWREAVGRQIGFNRSHLSEIEAATADFRAWLSARMEDQGRFNETVGLTIDGPEPDPEALSRARTFHLTQTSEWCRRIQEAYEAAAERIGEDFLVTALYTTVAPTAFKSFNLEDEAEAAALSKGTCR